MNSEESVESMTKGERRDVMTKDSEEQQQQLETVALWFRQGRTERCVEDTRLALKGDRNMMHASMTKHGGWMVHPHEHKYISVG
jgi:nitrogen fixation protein FixH